MGATEAVIELGPGCAAAGMAEVLGILSSADCLGCTLAKGAAGADTDEEEGVDEDVPGVATGVEIGALEIEGVEIGAPELAGVETGATEVAGVTSTAGAAWAAGTATGVVVGAVTGTPEVVGVASTAALGCSVGGVLVGTNSGALGFNEAELGLTEATAVGAAIWRIAGTAAVRG